MSTRHSSADDQTLSSNPGSVARSVELASQLKARLDAESGSVALDREFAAAIWAQLLANADLLRGLLAQKEAALNIDGAVFGCSQNLHDVLLPILQERMTRMAQEDINRDLAKLRSASKA